MARATAWRTFTLLNGGWRKFIRMMAWKPKRLTISACAPEFWSSNGTRSAGMRSR